MITHNYTHNHNRLLKTLRTLHPSAGFTIIEVLVAAILTMFVMTIAGTGLVKILGSNYKANAASEIRNNMDRTVEFISDEIRRAEFIADEMSKVDSASKKAVEDKGGKVVLAVRLPEYQNQIVYYTKAAANPWVGPKVLYRYGPPLAVNGELDKTGVELNADGKYTAAKWTHSPLVDMLVSEKVETDKDCDPFRNNEKPDNNRANDPPGWKMMPQDGASTTAGEKLDGFFVCVKGQLVMLRLNSQVPTTTKETLTYNVDTTVYGRSALTTPPTTKETPDKCTDPSCITAVVKKPPCDPSKEVCEKPPCDPLKEVCWKSIPVVTDDAKTEYAVKFEKDSAGKIKLSVKAPGINSIYGSYPGIQSVDIYTKDTLPKTFDISLSENQTLYVLKQYKLNKEYQIVVTFDSKGNPTSNLP